MLTPQSLVSVSEASPLDQLALSPNTVAQVATLSPSHEHNAEDWNLDAAVTPGMSRGPLVTSARGGPAPVMVHFASMKPRLDQGPRRRQERSVSGEKSGLRPGPELLPEPPPLVVHQGPPRAATGPPYSVCEEHLAALYNLLGGALETRAAAGARRRAHQGAPWRTEECGGPFRFDPLRGVVGSKRLREGWGAQGASVETTSPCNLAAPRPGILALTRGAFFGPGDYLVAATPSNGGARNCGGGLPTTLWQASFDVPPRASWPSREHRLVRPQPTCPPLQPLQAPIRLPLAIIVALHFFRWPSWGWAGC